MTHFLNKYLVLITIGLGTIGSSSAQYSSFERWGVGIITDPEHEGKYWENLAKKLIGLVFYDEPNGLPNGKLIGGGKSILSCSRETQKIHSDDIREYSYEVNGLIFLEEDEGFLKILYHTHEGGVWIKRSDIDQIGWQVEYWMDFFIQRKPTLFPGSMGIRMNLRASPRADAGKLVLLADDHYLLEPTGQVQGVWIEAKVKQYRGEYCDDDNQIVNTWTGWIKLLDEQGHPNMWYYTRGC